MFRLEILRVIGYVIKRLSPCAQQSPEAQQWVGELSNLVREMSPLTWLLPGLSLEIISPWGPGCQTLELTEASLLTGRG